MKQNERNFWLDSSLFIIFLSTIFTGFLLWILIPHQTAVVILGLNRDFWRSAHICSGLAIAVGNIVHIIWHRDWFKALRKRPIASLSPKLRANRVIDRLIWMIFLATGVFGALAWILSAGGSIVSISSRLHVAFAMAWLVGITIHLALHKKWIMSTTRRFLWVSIGPSAPRTPSL